MRITVTSVGISIVATLFLKQPIFFLVLSFITLYTSYKYFKTLLYHKRCHELMGSKIDSSFLGVLHFQCHLFIAWITSNLYLNHCISLHRLFNYFEKSIITLSITSNCLRIILQVQNYVRNTKNSASCSSCDQTKLFSW